MFCKNCGAQLKDGARFCAKCGTPVKQPAAGVMEKPEEREQETPRKQSGAWKILIPVALVAFLAVAGVAAYMLALRENAPLRVWHEERIEQKADFDAEKDVEDADQNETDPNETETNESIEEAPTEESSTTATVEIEKLTEEETTAAETTVAETDAAGGSWRKYANGSRYVTAKGTFLGSGWQQILDDWYLLDKQGYRLTGWQTVDGVRYYLDEDGRMLTGWFTLNDNWYYANEDGVVQTGWIEPEQGNYYYLNADGSMAHDEMVDGYWLDSNGLWVDNQSAANQQSAKTVSFDLRNENGKEFAIIKGKDNNQNVVWEYQTQKHELTELMVVQEIGIFGDQYYFAENGTVIALKVSDGTKMWENKELQGTGINFDFGGDGTLYLCGYYGPDFFAVDKNGKTLAKIEQFDSEYYWAYSIEAADGYAEVTLDVSPDGEGQEAVFEVDLKDFSYNLKEQYRESSCMDDAGKYIGTKYDSEIYISMYTSPDDEWIVGNVEIYSEDGEYDYSSEIAEVMENAYVLIDTEDDVVLETFEDDGTIWLRLFINEEYIDAYWMQEHYES